MEDNEATGVRLSWQALGALMLCLIAAGGGIATIQIQVSTLSHRVAELSADIVEVRGEVRVVNNKLDRYIELLLEEQNGIKTGSSTARRGR